MDALHSDYYRIMICRNVREAEPHKNLTILGCYLLSITSVLNVCSQIEALVEQKKVPPIKYLLANAGLFTETETKKQVGEFEATGHTNVIVNCYLMKELLGTMIKIRVFLTDSNIHYADRSILTGQFQNHSETIKTWILSCFQ